MEAFISAIRNRNLNDVQRFFYRVNYIHRVSSIHFGNHFHYETSPLHEAASRGDVSILSLLLKRGGNVNIELSDGKTPLHMASIHNRKEAVRFLLQNGANPNVECCEGYNAKEEAIRRQYWSIASLF